MDLVLGLSVTSTAVRWVLVEGTSGEGAPVDRGALDITDDAPFDADGLLSVLLDANEPVVESGVHAVGVTWTTDADAAALAVLEALDARGVQNVVSVSEIEAAEALAGGIAEIAGYDDVAVCIFEPDATLVAVVNAAGVTVDRHDRPTDGDDNVELTSSVIALNLNDRQLDSIFVVGSSDLDTAVSSIDTVAAAPVISSAEADMAMARGAAVAAALAVNTLDGAAGTAAETARDVEDRRVDVRRRRRSGHPGGLAVGRAGSSGYSGCALRTDSERERHRRAGSGRSAVGGEDGAGRAKAGAASRRTAQAGSRRKARSRGTPAACRTPAACGAAAGSDDGRCASGSRRACTGSACVCPARAGPGVCTARAGPGVRSAAAASPGGAAETATARQDHRAHSDHQPVPRAAAAHYSTPNAVDCATSALYMTRKANVRSLFA